MKTFILRTNLALALSALALGAVVSASRAQVQFTDDFEGYADQTAFNSAWTANGTTMTFTTTNRSHSGGAKSILQDATALSSVKRMTNAIWSTNLYFRCYFYDGAANNSGRSWAAPEQCDDTTYGVNVGQKLGIGRYNSISGSKYYGRQSLGGPIPGEGATAVSSGWFQLGGAANTSLGWHKAEIVGGYVPNSLGTTTIRYRYYIDGTLGGSTTADVSNRRFNWVLCGSKLSSSGNTWFDEVAVEALQMVPQITTQPADQTVNELDPVTFIIVVTNSPATNMFALNTLKYQWQFNNADIPGATGSSYAISHAKMADTGNYDSSGTYGCIVSDAYGSQWVVSYQASLGVNAIQAPVIDQAPTNQLVNVGSDASFYVTAHGGGNLYYTWRFYGTNIAFSGTDNFYTITGVTSAGAGPYSVVVTNDLGSPGATSTPPATLTVNLPPSLTSATNQAVLINTLASIRMRATDDLSSESSLFQDFDAYAAGAHVMFDQPSFSGTTGSGIDTSQPNASIVTNNYPAGHGSPRTLAARWTWTNNPPGTLRFTTASSGGGVSIGGSPIISFTNRLRFDIYVDRDLQVGLGVRESNPTGAIGTSDSATSGALEWIGVTAGVPARTVSAGAWTTLDFDPLADPIQSAYGTGNGVLNSTTGKGALEHLYLVPADGQPNAYTMYLDNFLVVASKPITFALDSGPVDATIDPYSGVITWAPSALGPTNFTVIATDYYGLSATNTFTVSVVNPAATIVLASPTNSQSFSAPATVSLSATVTPNGNTIDYVGFYNGTSWAYVTNSPYSTSFASLGVGTYPISATAFYGGMTAKSATNTITVINPAPPVVGHIAVSGGNVTISGTTDPNRTVVTEKATSLAAPINWTPVHTNNADVSGNLNIIIPVVPGDAAAFFRAK